MTVFSIRDLEDALRTPAMYSVLRYMEQNKSTKRDCSLSTKPGYFTKVFISKALYGLMKISTESELQLSHR